MGSIVTSWYQQGKYTGMTRRIADDVYIRIQNGLGQNRQDHY
jgi:hypothetical protein